MKNSSLEVTMAGLTKKMKVVPPTSHEDKQQVELFRKKYLPLRLYNLISPNMRPHRALN